LVHIQRREDARLARYNGPFFPATIGALNSELDALGDTDYEFFDRIAHVASPGLLVRGFPATSSDGYVWLRMLEFSRGQSRIVIAIPADGGTTSAAVYAYGIEATEEALEDVVTVYVSALRQLRNQNDE
jgi:hypothetical protein